LPGLDFIPKKFAGKGRSNAALFDFCSSAGDIGSDVHALRRHRLGL
jgi:hypothetical protein